MKPAADCPCGSGRAYAVCCQPLHQGQPAASAEALMRSRYAAFVLKLADYLLFSWCPQTRPGELDLSADDTKWLGLEVKKHAQQDASHATVEFVARYRVGGRGHRLHEISRFAREGEHWQYLDGELLN